MGTGGGGGVFVSYRRVESSGYAGWLADRLIDRFGAKQVFMDVHTIEPGVDFAEAISRAVDACVVLVAVIGPGWLAAADERGGRRLDDPDDFVRLEIGAALERGVRVIPVLVEDAVMPRRADLPDGLAGLAQRHALRIRHESFGDDAGRLVAAIERALAAATADVVHGANSAWSPGNAPVGGADVKEGSGSGWNDPARAARLIGDAERIANSIASKSEKARALSLVAAAVAATDLARAARLLGDAERIANSLTDESAKAEALSDVAAAVAATDPERAERIANSINQLLAKISALNVVAVAMAATDPTRAARIANSNIDEYKKASVLRDVMAAAAATNPKRAERIANSLTDESRKASVLRGVAAAVAASDPESAEDIANSIIDQYQQVRALIATVRTLAA